MTNLTYLFAAYTVIWVALFLYIFSLSRKTRQLEKMLVALRKGREKKKHKRKRL